MRIPVKEQSNQATHQDWNRILSVLNITNSSHSSQKWKTKRVDKTCYMITIPNLPSFLTTLWNYPLNHCEAS